MEAANIGYGKVHHGNIEKRLAEMDAKIRDPSFRRTTKKANEVNYWVFDYAPKDELIVRGHVAYLKKRNHPDIDGYELCVYDLYDVIMDYLESKPKDFIARTAKIEEQHGFHNAALAVQRTLRINERSNYLVEYITAHTPKDAIVFLIGVGKCYPLLEAQEIFYKVFYNMPREFLATPMVLFYPGTYTEQELIVFDEEKEDNYYRAFRIAR